MSGISRKVLKTIVLAILLVPAPLIALLSWFGLISGETFEWLARPLYWPFLISLFSLLALLAVGMVVILARRIRKRFRD